MPSSRYTFAAATGWDHVAAETWLTPSSRPPPIGQCGECQTPQLPLPGACGNGMCSWARTLTEAAAIVLCGNGSFDNLPRKTSLRLYVRLLGCLLQRRCANVTYGSCGRAGVVLSGTQKIACWRTRCSHANARRHQILRAAGGRQARADDSTTSSRSADCWVLAQRSSETGCAHAR